MSEQVCNCNASEVISHVTQVTKKNREELNIDISRPRINSDDQIRWVL